jgi:hypothetical protein
MTVQEHPGELLVGAYHRVINGCELVSYNQRSQEQGNQMELDVLAIQSENGNQTVYACEVITHINGMLYTGSPSTDRWSEFGNDNYQRTLERIWKKFEVDFEYVTAVFDTADAYHLQLWSPVVPEGHRTKGLEVLGPELEEELSSSTKAELEVELFYNESYTERIDALRDEAQKDAGGTGNIGFRLLQILENLR